MVIDDHERDEILTGCGLRQKVDQCFSRIRLMCEGSIDQVNRDNLQAFRLLAANLVCECVWQRGGSLDGLGIGGDFLEADDALGFAVFAHFKFIAGKTVDMIAALVADHHRNQHSVGMRKYF